MLDISVKDFKKLLESTPIEDLCDILESQKGDTRQGIQNLIVMGNKKIIEYNKEEQRILSIKNYENELRERGYKYIGGVDEVGRGPLAGPVVSCVVVFDSATTIHGINDSKKISEKNRNRLYNEIIEKALSVSIGICTNDEIDSLNIRGATLLSMEKAVLASKVKPDFLLIDGLDKININMHQEAMIKGDENSFSIAAASIIAKVTRDEMMKVYDSDFPEYNFKSNKGYGSKEHILAIRKFGLTSIHRKSFTKNIK